MLWDLEDAVEGVEVVFFKVVGGHMCPIFGPLVALFWIFW